MGKIGKVIRDPNFPLAFVRGNVAIGMNPRTKRQKKLTVVEPIRRRDPTSIVFIKKNGDVFESPRVRRGRGRSKAPKKRSIRRKTKTRKKTKKKTKRRKRK